ncbi:MAG: radical SAM family heme chaperone HemW [Acidimicrobiia bacterium]|jgi:oxygen-independent coproporphyrinogen-3 oxidase
MKPEEADSFVAHAAAYVHIPFCSAVCPYCDFAVVAGRDDLAHRYTEAVVTEIASSPSWRPLHAVYFGGGTPSHIAPDLLGSILEGLAARHGISSGAEISLEANPEDFTTAKAKRLRSIGFNRVSFGAQSFDPAVLSWLGRRHRPTDIVRSVRSAREAGLENLSIDLIFGSPGETTESWLGTLHQAIGIGVDHVSAYALTVERGTSLGRSVAGGAPAPDPDVQAERYELADEHLMRAGLARYEVSNWARPGRECRYNLTVWAQGEYEGYGNGAHGHRDGVRYRNHRRLEAYLSAVEQGRSPRVGEEVISGWDSELDRVFVGLRRTVGVASGPGTDALVASPNGRVLAEAEIIEQGPHRLRVIKPLLTDAVQRSVLAQDGPIVVGDGHA